MSGQILDEEPIDVDCLVGACFELCCCPDDPQGIERRSYMAGELARVARACGVTDAQHDRAVHVLLNGHGEVRAWELMAEFCLDRGFDIYDSDTRFEVYTPEPSADDPRYGIFVLGSGTVTP